MKFDALMDKFTRVCAGTLTVARDDSGKEDVTWKPPRTIDDEDRDFAERLGRNVGRKLVDFGEVRTDGAFRLTTGTDEMTVTPLPGSRPFRASFDLAKLGFAGRSVRGIRRAGADEPSAPVKRVGDVLAVAFGEGDAPWVISFELKKQ